MNVKMIMMMMMIQTGSGSGPIIGSDSRAAPKEPRTPRGYESYLFATADRYAAGMQIFCANNLELKLGHVLSRSRSLMDSTRIGIGMDSAPQD